ncbi:MAG TPA: GAF domain-containing sensor histidine kinase [Trueperaceae bacterium]|nr:GAF domain-containing sensor histidine kinase [Trueperaceae bacterium]
MTRTAGQPGRARVEGVAGLYEQVRLARLWLPLAIVGVVLVHQLLIVPLLPPDGQFWAQLLFYSILGPFVTYVTLNWIAGEVRDKERAQLELAELYRELQASHELLSSIQGVTERFAASPSLESTVRAAAEGVAGVTGAGSVAVVLGPEGLGVTHGLGLDENLERDALSRDEAARRRARRGEVGVRVERLHEGANASLYALTAPVVWAGEPEGSLTAYLPAAPDERALESFSIVSSQFSAAAEATRLRTRDVMTLVEVDRSIRAEGNLGRLLTSVLTRMLTFVSAPVGGIFLADSDGLLRLAATVGRDPGNPARAWRVGEGIVGGVAARREPRIVDSLAAEAEGALQYGPLLQGAGSALAAPLVAGDELLGVLVLAHPEEGHFDRSVLPFMGLVAGQVSLAIRNASAYLQSEELAISEERSRIAREIHDGVAQMLAFAALKLDLVQRLMTRDPAKAAAELEQAKETVRESIREVRRSIFALRPVDLERFGFAETVRRYALDFGQQNDVKVEVSFGPLPELSLKSEAVLFRIFQEAMHNVAKHARAQNVEVRLGTTEDGMAFVAVRDDGVGFDVDQVADRVTSAGGLGIKQMRERVEARGGRLEIDAAPARGTELYAAVPV